MRNENEFDFPAEFGGKSEEELLEEFMDECTVSADSYISVYGGYFDIMKELSSAEKDVFMWMVFNCEIDKGRIALQTFAVERLLKELGIALVTYYKCLGNLKTKNCIRGAKAKYYINPRMAWRGCDARRKKFVSRYSGIRNSK